MKIQRYEIVNPSKIWHGNLICKSEDVEKLEQINAEMLEALEVIDNEVDIYNPRIEDKLKSIIEKAEAMK